MDGPPDQERLGAAGDRRLGVYVAPRSTSPLGGRGARWLGRSLDPGPAPELPEVDLDAEVLRELTAEPRPYGFHGTLRAPFHLADGVEPDDVHLAVERLAASLPVIDLAGLAVDVTRGFAALVPTAPSAALAEVEQACVVDLDHLRRPLDDVALARRRRRSLTPRQDELLVAYGYPWVLDELRFHLTLTRTLREDEVEPVLAAARSWFAPVLDGPVRFDELCVVEQPEPGAPFVAAARYPLRRPPVR